MESYSTDKKPQFSFDSGDHIWFTSDTHFNHDKIIEYCKRPFNNAAHMTEELIKNWNNKVQPDDIIFHLGDFAWGGSDVWNKIIDRLNGKKYLILGNHDEKNIRQGYINKFEWVGYQMHINIEGKSIYLNHFPFLCFGGAYRGEQAVWQLFGHVHSGPYTQTGLDVQRLVNLFPTQYDVGVDNNNYSPVSFAELKTIIDNRQQSLNLTQK